MSTTSSIQQRRGLSYHSDPCISRIDSCTRSPSALFLLDCTGRNPERYVALQQVLGGVRLFYSYKLIYLLVRVPRVQHIMQDVMLENYSRMLARGNDKSIGKLVGILQ